MQALSLSGALAALGLYYQGNNLNGGIQFLPVVSGISQANPIGGSFLLCRKIRRRGKGEVDTLGKMY